MQKIKDKIKTFLLDTGGAITAGIGLANLGVYILEADVWFLVTGILLLATGLVDIANEDKDV